MTDAPLTDGTTPTTGRAVRFDHYGDRDVLRVEEVSVREPGPDEVLVEVKAAGTNPGEAAIRQGFLDSMFPATFPSGQGSDFAGVVVATGSDVTGRAPGDEVLGWSWERSSHAEYVVAPAAQVTAKPGPVSWEVAGSLFVAGTTARAAVDAVSPRAGETIVVSGAAGGVGSIVTQLLVLQGVDVIGIASEGNHDWLRSVGARPVAYGDGLRARIDELAPDGVSALVDTFGEEYVRLGIDLGVPAERIETMIAFEAAAEVGAQTKGSTDAASATVLHDLVMLVSHGKLSIPVDSVFALDDVQQAFEKLEQHHAHGKIVLVP
ncbi:NADP-dependent oxidoreductase [Frondihabitans cladoniiphilus]|uniref:NADP-dependent oxidoreductase n=1 Tax=Frondihabitans cladoniiphilus TaxID=715785 RepID=A0ABP8VPZ4_9MICO